MNLVPKRLLLVGAAPLAIAAVYGGSIAFAQSGEDSTQTPTPTEDTSPQAPTTPGGKEGCDHARGGSGSSDSQSADGTSTQIRTRARIGTARVY